MPGQQGEDESFEAFFLTRRRTLSRAAFFLTGDDHEAEELFQAAMVQAYARWSHIVRRGLEPERYVRAIMLNKARDNWRSMVRRRRRAHETHLAAVVEDFSGATLNKEVIGNLLRQLAPQQRAILYLRFALDYSEAQAADALGCGVGTIKSQTHRALSRLRDIAGPAVERSGSR